MSILETLEAAGASCEEIDTTSNTSFEVNGIPIGGGEKVSTRYEWDLPKPTAIQAGFAKEGLGKKLVKLFKKELQTGDKAFDDIVYVTTSDERLTAGFLKDETMRNTISEIVAEGGSIIVEEKRVLYSVAGDLTPKQRIDMERFVGKVGGLL